MLIPGLPFIQDDAACEIDSFPITHETGNFIPPRGDRFIPNEGQIGNPDILFTTPDGGLYFTCDGFFMKMRSALATEQTLDEFEERPEPFHLVNYQFQGASGATPVGKEKLNTRYNYFLGDIQRTDIQGFREIVYTNVWNGIDIIYKFDDGSLKYDIVLNPGSDHKDICLKVDGVDELRSDQTNIEVITSSGSFFDGNLKIFYEHEEDNTIEGRFVLKGNNAFGFDLDGADTSKKIIIDPLVYSTYFGGSGSEWGRDIYTDSIGNPIIVGYAMTGDYPTSAGAYDDSYAGNGEKDATITKVNITSGEVMFSTYLGGSEYDSANTVCVDKDDHIYVSGYTGSNNFPLTPDAYDSTRNSDECFIAIFNPDGNDLNYSTFFGGPAHDICYRIRFLDEKNLTLVGATASSSLPALLPAPFDQGHGDFDVMLSVFNIETKLPEYSAIIGGLFYEHAISLHIFENRTIAITGKTQSPDFPTSPNAFNDTYGGVLDGFVLVFDTETKTTILSSYVGGSSDDECRDVHFGNDGSVYVCGYTTSPDLYTTPGTIAPYFHDFYDYSEGFITRFDPNSGMVLDSTYIGYYYSDSCRGVEISKDGDVVISGYSYGYFTTIGANESGDYLSGDILLIVLDENLTDLKFSPIYGGDDFEYATFMHLRNNSEVYLTGYTYSTDFPCTPNAPQKDYGGGVEDSFIMKIDIPDFPDPPENVGYIFSTDFLNLTWSVPTSGVTPTHYGVYYKNGDGNFSEGVYVDTVPADQHFLNLSMAIQKGQTYSFWIVSSNKGSVSEPSNKLFVNYTTVPSKPTITNIEWDQEEVEINFLLESDGGDPNILFQIFRGPSEDNMTLFADDLTITTWYDHNCSIGRQYFYSVRAKNSIGFGEMSDVLSISTNGPPTEPRFLKLQTGNGFHNLSWKPPLNPGSIEELEYRLYVSSSAYGDDYDADDIFITNDLYYNITGWGCHPGLFYMVKARTTYGWSNFSNEVNDEYLVWPSEVIGLSTISGNEKITLNWNKPVEDNGFPVLGYKVYKGTSRENLGLLAELEGAGNISYIDDGIENGINFYYGIAAKNYYTEGDLEIIGPVSAKDLPRSVSDLTVLIDNNTIKLNWIFTKGAEEVSFVIYRKTESSDWLEIQEITDLEYTDSSNLVLGTTYYYKVVPSNRYGESQNNKIMIIDYLQEPSAPRNFKLELKDKDTLELTWSAPGSNGGDEDLIYSVYRGGSIGEIKFIGTTGNLKIYEDDLPAPGSSFFYQVAARNGRGLGPRTEIIEYTVPAEPFEKDDDPPVVVDPVNEGTDSDEFERSPMDAVIIIVAVIVLLALIGVSLYFFFKPKKTVEKIKKEPAPIEIIRTVVKREKLKKADPDGEELALEVEPKVEEPGETSEEPEVDEEQPVIEEEPQQPETQEEPAIEEQPGQPSPQEEPAVEEQPDLGEAPTENAKTT